MFHLPPALHPQVSMMDPRYYAEVLSRSMVGMGELPIHYSSQWQGIMTQSPGHGSMAPPPGFHAQSLHQRVDNFIHTQMTAPATVDQAASFYGTAIPSSQVGPFNEGTSEGSAGQQTQEPGSPDSFGPPPRVFTDQSASELIRLNEGRHIGSLANSPEILAIEESHAAKTSPVAMPQTPTKIAVAIPRIPIRQSGAENILPASYASAAEAAHVDTWAADTISIVSEASPEVKVARSEDSDTLITNIDTRLTELNGLSFVAEPTGNTGEDQLADSSQTESIVPTDDADRWQTVTRRKEKGPKNTEKKSAIPAIPSPEHGGGAPPDFASTITKKDDSAWSKPSANVVIPNRPKNRQPASKKWGAP
ncbi:hypothetical protein I316_03050 [Kwoniella heveanensis BCC8398]|uniref:Uncharacterized protein n=1 Tax=Kwoniella heveanensis BCC8398 TaxID=1296120 RepID=A0A1B9GVF2_9TREE|nr:hypothetical protein I316_03050 [Kwoniella heveanensis BCC8398]